MDPKLAAALQAALEEWRRQTDTVGVTMAVRLPGGGNWTGAAALAGRQPLQFAPGHDYSYSNTNYVLLGLAAQAATRTPLVQLLHRRVFAPAGLGDTLLAGAEPVHGGIVHGYGRVNVYQAHPAADGKEHVYDGVPHQPGTLPYRAFETASSFAGGMVSTAPDLVRFATALFHGDLLHAATREQMLTFGTQPYRYYSYGLGVQLIATWAGPGWGHGGGLPGYSSILVDVPGSQITVAVLSNQDRRDLGPLVDKVLQVLHAARHASCDGRPC